jgi:hypothetical protein
MNNEQPSISLNDFAMVISIIDACSERGAFKGNELATVGQLRERFALFIKVNTPATETKEETVEEEAE